MADLSIRNAPRRSASRASMAVLISLEIFSCRVISGGLRRVQIAQGVAHLCGLLVILSVDGLVEGGFELLAFGEGTLGADFFHPEFEGADFAALIFGEFGAAVLLGKLAQFVE